MGAEKDRGHKVPYRLSEKRPDLWQTSPFCLLSGLAGEGQRHSHLDRFLSIGNPKKLVRIEHGLTIPAISYQLARFGHAVVGTRHVFC